MASRDLMGFTYIPKKEEQFWTFVDPKNKGKGCLVLKPSQDEKVVSSKGLWVWNPCEKMEDCERILEDHSIMLFRRKNDNKYSAVSLSLYLSYGVEEYLGQAESPGRAIVIAALLHKKKESGKRDEMD